MLDGARKKNLSTIGRKRRNTAVEETWMASGLENEELPCVDVDFCEKQIAKCRSAKYMELIFIWGYDKQASARSNSYFRDDNVIFSQPH